MERAISRSRWPMVGCAAAAMLAVSAWASATTTHYVTHFTTLNNSGVTGSANVWFDSATNMLKVHVMASGLEPNEPHAQHIHGTLSNGFSGTPTQAMTPTSADDTNGDGLIEVTEGAAAYGPILVPLTTNGVATGVFPTAPNGTIDYTQTFDVTNPSIYFTNPVNGFMATEADLFPLNFREIVLHGLTTPIDITNGGLDGHTFFAAGSYVGTLPVASGVLMTAVPEPEELGMITGGLGLLLGFLWLRRRTDCRRMDA